MTEGPDLRTLCRDGVRNFLQTVLVIDNELTFGDPLAPAGPLVPPRSGMSRRIPGGPTPTGAAVSSSGIAPSPLDAKAIMDAFLRQSLICGMHKPARGDDLVPEAIRAAQRSDAVIVDWRLDGGDTTPAKDIIAGILVQDRLERGRLRLIVVYTSEPDTAEVARELGDHLSLGAFTQPGVIMTRDTRIVVLNKSGTTGARDPVEAADLPTRLVEEFAHLTDGILGTFAVTAIASVRRATHHVLSVFSRDLDGAYVSHQVSLETPDDAPEFAMELLAGELRSVVAMDASAMRVLSSATAGRWIETRAIDGKLFTGEFEIPVEIAREFPLKGATSIKKSKQHQRWRGTSAPLGKDDPGVTLKNVGDLFHDDAATSREAHHRFSRLAAFKSEPFGRTPVPNGWVPTLSLGTLVRRMGATSGDDRYLLCTQPRCDAVRLATARMFPFQAGAEVSKAPFNLVVSVPDAEPPAMVTIRMGGKPSDTRIIAFEPNGDGRVIGVRTGTGAFHFTDKEGCSYVWLGDLRDLAAQRAASQVAARLHEVGVDEFEWLRQKARPV